MTHGNKNLEMHLAILLVVIVMLAATPRAYEESQTGPPLLSWAFLIGNPILFLPLLALAGTAGIWFAVARESRNGSVAVQYGPPQDLSPAEASTLLEESVKARAIIATLVDLAVRGYLSIEHAEGSGEHPKKEDYSFQNLRKPKWTSDLAPHEFGLMVHIFEYGEQPSLATLWHGLPDYVPQMKENIFRSLAAKRMYRLNPIWSGTILIVGGFAVLLFLWLVANAFNVKLTGHDMLNPVCFALAMTVIFFFSRKITLRSALGAERWRQIKGFQEFMTRVDGDRIKSISPDLFERFLPYAIALGVDREWTANFKGILTRPPGWYAESFVEFVLAVE